MTILARLLTPVDFGTVALVAPLAAFVVMFQDLGLQQAIVQRLELSQDQLTQVFWFTAALGLACAGIMVASAPGLAMFFGDDRLVWLTIATAPSLMFGAIGSVPTAMLNRAMRFQTLAGLDIAASFSVFVMAILSAWFGAHYWALVIGTLSGSTVALAGAWWAAGWKPGPPSLRLPDRGMLGFGANLTGFSFLVFLARNLDNVLIGRFVGSVALGYYDRAYKLLLFPLANVNAPLARIAVPLLSRIHTDRPRLRDAFLRIASQVGLLTIPGMAALVATSDETVRLVFGPGWHLIVPIFAWLGLAGLLQPTTYAASWLLVAQGRTATLLHWGVYTSSTSIVAFLIGLHWGAVGVACAYTLTDYIVRLPVLYFVINHVGPVTALDLFKLQAPLLAGAGLTAIISARLFRDYFGLAGIQMVGATVLVSYGIAIGLMATIPQSRLALRETLVLFLKVTQDAWRVRSA